MTLLDSQSLHYKSFFNLISFVFQNEASGDRYAGLLSIAIGRYLVKPHSKRYNTFKQHYVLIKVAELQAARSISTSFETVPKSS